MTSPIANPPCKICPGGTHERLRLPADRRPEVAGTAAPVPYFACERCGFLFSTHLDGPEASLPYGEDYFDTTDMGAAQRAEVPRSLAFQLRDWLGLPIEPVLDFGSGTGLAVAAMREGGLEAYGVDIVEPEAAREHIHVGLLDETDRYGLVTAVEVFEHLPDPVAAVGAIARALRPGGLLAMTTAVHRPENLDPGWWYLAPGAGHIALFTHPALEALAERTGFHVLFATATNHYWIKGPLPPWRLAALRARLQAARALGKLKRMAAAR